MADRPGSKELGTNVRALRRARELTQVELAAKVGITKSYVSRIETGTRPVTPDLLGRLASALDVATSTLDETTVLETRTTAWRIEYAAPEDANAEPWARYDTVSDPDKAKATISAVREAPVGDIVRDSTYPNGREWRWRAVRVETIETVEVW